MKKMRKNRSRIVAFMMTLMVTMVMMPMSSVVWAAQGKAGQVTILYTNDVHTYIDNSKGSGSNAVRYSTVAGYKDELKAAGKNVLLVDAGDNIQGTAYGGMDLGESVIDIMNTAGYTASAIGNHEFDYSMSGFLNARNHAKFSYLSSNLYKVNSKGGKKHLCRTYKVKKIGGVKVAFVGITTPESITKSSPKYFQNKNGKYIYDIAGRKSAKELYAAVQKTVNAANKKADVVIALGHLGVNAGSKPWRSTDVIAHTTGIDAFIDGHSHTTMPGTYYKNKRGKKVLLTQTGYSLNALGEMTVTKKSSGKYSISSKLLTADDLGSVAPNAAVKAKEDALIAKVDSELGEKVGTSKINFVALEKDKQWAVRTRETNLGDFCADAYYWYANEKASLDCDLAIMNGGGIRTDVPAGTDWTYKTCKSINPFGNVLCVAEVSGQDILDALEFGARLTPDASTGGFMHVAGITFKIDTSVPNTVHEENKQWVSGPDAYRVYDVKVYDKKTGKYQPLDTAKTYRVCGTNYTLMNSGDGFNMFSDSKLVLDGVAQDYLALAEYAQNFKDTDGDGYANIASSSSPLASYAGYTINYENESGAGRISAAAGKAQ